MSGLFGMPTIWADKAHWNAPDEISRIKRTIDSLPRDTKSVLDVGCGSGIFLRHLKRAKPTLLCEGVEQSKAAVDGNCSGVPIVQGSIDRLPYQDRQFDAISVLEVLEHLPLDIYDRGLEELARVAGRYIIVSVPFRENRTNVICPYCACEFNANTHLRSYNDNAMSELFPGFRCLELDAIGSKREFFLGKYRNEFRRVFARRALPRNFVCPQCHYVRHVDNMGLPEDLARGFLKSIIKRLFFFNRPRWYLAVYKRVTVASG